MNATEPRKMQIAIDVSESNTSHMLLAEVQVQDIHNEAVGGNSSTISKSGGTPGELPKLSTIEYGRRKCFLGNLKGLTKAEYIEIVRLLQKHEVVYSENHNGIFLNLTALSQDVFDDLERFLLFTQQNRQNLSDRDCFMSTLLVQNPDI